MAQHLHRNLRAENLAGKSMLISETVLMKRKQRRIGDRHWVVVIRHLHHLIHREIEKSEHKIYNHGWRRVEEIEVSFWTCESCRKNCMESVTSLSSFGGYSQSYLYAK